MEKKKILLIALRTGGGHLAMANAIKSILDPEKYEVIICSDLKDPLYFDKSSEIYSFLSSFKPIWQFLWNISDGPLVPLFFNWYGTFVALRNFSYFKAIEPNMVVAMNPLINSIPKYISKRLSIPCAVFVNDPFSVHYGWISPDLDYCLVPFEETKQSAERLGAGNVHVLTLPINKKFLGTKDRSSIFESLGLDDKYTILLSSGGDGHMGETDILALVSQPNTNYNLIIVCGNNQKLYKKLSVDFADRKNIKVLGYVNNMDELLAVADVHFTKGGPNAIHETLVSGAIPYVYSYYPGQETGNVESIDRLGIGMVGNIFELAKSAFLNTEKKSEFKDKIKAYLDDKKLLSEGLVFNDFFDNVFSKEYAATYRQRIPKPQKIIQNVIRSLT